MCRPLRGLAVRLAESRVAATRCRLMCEASGRDYFDPVVWYWWHGMWFQGPAYMQERFESFQYCLTVFELWQLEHLARLRSQGPGLFGRMGVKRFWGEGEDLDSPCDCRCGAIEPVVFEGKHGWRVRCAECANRGPICHSRVSAIESWNEVEGADWDELAPAAKVVTANYSANHSSEPA